MHIKQAQSRLRWSPIVAVVAIALVVALSGSATAAVMIGSKQIKKNAVGTKHLKNGAVGPKQIKNRAVNGKKIKANAIKPGHISPQAKNQLAGQEGPQGPKGDPGDPGPAGGLSGYEVVPGAETAILPGSSSTLSVNCPGGKRAISGGVDSLTPDSVIYESTVMGPTGFGWQIGVKNTGGSEITMLAHAICVDAAS